MPWRWDKQDGLFPKAFLTPREATLSSLCSFENRYQLIAYSHMNWRMSKRSIASLGGANIWITYDDDSLKDITAEWWEWGITEYKTGIPSAWAEVTITELRQDGETASLRMLRRSRFVARALWSCLTGGTGYYDNENDDDWHLPPIEQLLYTHATEGGLCSGGPASEQHSLRSWRCNCRGERWFSW
jgi:hypothetical protein